MLRHYIKTAIRQLVKYKTQNLISIAGLSVGIVCFSICLYCSRFIGEVNKCFPNKERIADINLYSPDRGLYAGVPATLIENLRNQRLDEVQEVTFVVYPRGRSYNVEVEEGKELPYDRLITMETDSLFGKSVYSANHTRFMGSGRQHTQCRSADPVGSKKDFR